MSMEKCLIIDDVIYVGTSAAGGHKPKFRERSPDQEEKRAAAKKIYLSKKRFLTIFVIILKDTMCIVFLSDDHEDLFSITF